MQATKTAIFASGCFWGTQYYFNKAKGVIKTEVGYTGGSMPNPTYEKVSSGDTGHVESVLVEYDPEITSYRQLAKLFFETHDSTQQDGQGPDIGSQYQSVIFYQSEEERETAEDLIDELTSKGMRVATRVEKAGKFYIAEGYHQNYYSKTGGSPYCHSYHKLF